MIYNKKARFLRAFLATRAGGDEENRTPVRKPVPKSFSERSQSIKSPERYRRLTGYKARQPFNTQIDTRLFQNAFTTPRRLIARAVVLACETSST